MFPERYNINNLKKSLRNPRKFVEELQRLIRKSRLNVFKFITQIQFKMIGEEQTNVMNKDWDNLIILDACRYDVFHDVNNINCDLGYIISQGSHSKEFRDKTFTENTFHDTVYITANAFGAQLDNNTFHDILTTFDQSLEEESETAVHDNNNLAPSKVHELAIKAHTSYPDKKLIIHFMQPHEPYFGNEAEKLRKNLSLSKGIEFFAWDGDFEERNKKYVLRDLLKAAEEGYITNQELRSVYKENLQLVLQDVEKLIEDLDGKTVITADHGELLGDRILFSQRYHHPPETYVKELRKVPWLVIDSDDRRPITSESATENTNVDKNKINNQLEALGYK